MKLQLKFLILPLLITMACGDEGQPDDVGRRDVGNGGADATVEPPDEREFIDDVVEGLNTAALVGDYAVARTAPSGRPAVAYGYYLDGAERVREIHLAELGADGTWDVDVVVSPAKDFEPAAQEKLKGLGFDYVDGAPHIAYIGGDDDGHPALETLGDLALSVRNGDAWSDQLLAEGSAEATGECFDESNYCVQGVMVGLWATLRAAPSGGYAITYRDQHFGFGQEDRASADLELYQAPGGRQVMVDGGRSAGNRSDIAFLADGRLAVAYTLDQPDTIVSVWVAVESGGDWTRTRVSEDDAGHRVSLDVAPDGTIWLAYYDESNVDLVVASSSDEGETWTVERVEERGDTGLYPSLKVDADGNVLVAYTYCGSASDRDCPGQLGNDAEVRLATLPAGGTEWSIQRVSNNQGQGGAGEFVSLTVLPDGRVGVAFVDQDNSDLVFAREIE
jgi:hypothetical protein